MPESFEIYTMSLGNQEWTRFRLSADIGGERTELAYMDTPLREKDVPAEGKTISLRTAEITWRYVTGLSLIGEDGKELDPAYITTVLSIGSGGNADSGETRQVKLPALLGSSETGEDGTGLRIQVYCRNYWDAYYYRYLWSNQVSDAAEVRGFRKNTEEGGYTLLAVLRSRPEKVTVSGHVYYGKEPGEEQQEVHVPVPASGAEVMLHQSLIGRNTDALRGETGGYDYNTSVTADENGYYEAELYVDQSGSTAADIRVLWQETEMQVGRGRELSMDITGDVTQDIYLDDSWFIMELVPEGLSEDNDAEVYSRYLAAAAAQKLSGFQLNRQYTNGWWSVAGSHFRPGRERVLVSRGSEEVTRYYLSGDLLVPADPDTEPEWVTEVPAELSRAELPFRFRGGALMNLGIQDGGATTPYILRCFNGEGEQAGDIRLTVSAEARDYAVPRPDFLESGESCTVVFVPANAAYTLGRTLEETDPSLTRFEMQLEDGRFTDYGTFRLRKGD